MAGDELPICKVLLVGPDHGQGNFPGITNIMTRYVDDAFVPEHNATVGVDFRVSRYPKNSPDDQKKIKLQIWDTASAARFSAVTRAYYRGARIIVVCLKHNDRDTFQNLGDFIEQSFKLAAPDSLFYLALTCADIQDENVITDDEIEKFIEQYPRLRSFHRVSAKDNTGIDELFDEVAHAAMDDQPVKELGFENVFTLAQLKELLQRREYNIDDETQHAAIAKLIGKYINNLPDNINGLNKLVELHDAIGIGKGGGQGNDLYFKRLRNRKNRWGEEERCYRETNDSEEVSKACKDKAWKILLAKNKQLGSDDEKRKYEKILFAKCGRFTNFKVPMWKHSFATTAQKAYDIPDHDFFVIQ